MKKKWKILLGTVFALLTISIAVMESNKPLEASLLEVQPRTISKTFTEEGKVVADVERPLYSTYGGKIVELTVGEGQTVKKGDSLALLGTKELKYNLAQLRAKLKSVQAEQDLQNSKIDLQRKKQLYEQGAITEKEYQDAKETVNSPYYTALKEEINAQIELVQYKINESKITAPVNGVISGLDVKEGAVVTANIPIATVFQKNSFVVEVYVLTEDANSIKPKMPVQLVQSKKSGDIVFEGVVKKISPSAVERKSALGLDEQRVKVTIEPNIPKNLDLRPGYALDVKFTTDQKNNQLVVPKTTLFPYNNGKALWVVRNGEAKIQPVERGFENDQDVAILKGLTKGDQVLLNPQLEELKEGIRVKIKNES
ncbi:MAG: efflux RND transporter periplasmic adaptor subunit [Firmicutes bacterium]|nr:efflux RND transporter periplasmic adaptor subunit [Bacillota bacterium]